MGVVTSLLLGVEEASLRKGVESLGKFETWSLGFWEEWRKIILGNRIPGLVSLASTQCQAARVISTYDEM